MALRITIDAFSGRPNPVIELDDAAAREVAQRIKPADRLKRGETKPPPESILGYRGIVVEQIGDDRIKGLPARVRIVDGKLFGDKLAHVPADPRFEDFITGDQGIIRRLDIDDETLATIRKLVDARRILPWLPFEWPTLIKCRCAPLYEPAWWNDGGQKQHNNNCYNYGTNYRTDTFAQPGEASGNPYSFPITCAGVRSGAISDDLLHTPNANNKCPDEGHLVALVTYSGDYHWYRKGRNGLWTHKPGGTAVTNLDNSGHIITDPRTADRGPYTNFCTFMTVMHGHTKIR